jgi:simple sugar transport system substrate-binding protein
MRKGPLGIGSFLLAAVFTFSSELQAIASQNNPPKKEKIALIAHGGIGNPFWAVLFNGARQAAQDLNVHLQILFPNQDGDQQGTTQKLSEAISTRPDGIAVTLATVAHCDYIQEAREKDIPLVIFNARALKANAACPYQAYIGMDEYEAGRISGQRALASGRIKNRVLIGLTEPSHFGHQARARGIAEVLKAQNISVDIMDIGNDPAGVPSRLKGYFSLHSQDLSGIFVPAPIGMHPVLRMMENSTQPPSTSAHSS